MRVLRRGAAAAGVSLLECMLALSVTAVLAGILLVRLASYQAESERVATKQLIGALRTALALRSAEALTNTGEEGLIALAKENPIEWLQLAPHNYLGALYAPDIGKLPSGNWYFDKRDSLLIYLPSSGKSFSKKTLNILSFKVKLTSISNPVGGSGRSKLIAGLDLDQVVDAPAANPP